MSTVRLDGTAIRDEVSFHRECQRALGFPEFYGGNWNAWIDCMSYLADPTAVMSAIHVRGDEHLELEVTDTTGLSKRCAGVLADLIECTAVVNERFVTSGSGVRLSLTFLEGGPELDR